MTTPAILLMILALLIVWGGLVVSILALRARPERDDLPPGGEDDTRDEGSVIVHDT
ncbi:methionine/alanine import family NSS transporter small subunit [Isoptericola sp. NEAU-Y5]|uniref:Methionine/alanine import family NSS transporter small subunit n=1 Tax=Isoptericola luteus TaxID=2879484 RepID=A0ABS7ZA67_9MICO|nr:methionine/alanine import family NSS transporter small subunit [Isoptericola sp. NEAU-Y5]MCA5891778.1 methionine/alanine import family NSS transporter small subunit [Isoptericola sp. NEAU-Y5]MCA5894611.1 methionine/alanine import family NSS transporter small subunit [Isoptericola sp. NEAU-Y5]